MVYAPPFTISPESEDCIAEIEDSVSVLESHPLDPEELRLSRLRSALASAAIEGNHLTFDQAVDVIEGRDVSRPRREVLEVRNAFRCYEHLLDFDQNSMGDILGAHAAVAAVHDARFVGISVMQEDPLHVIARFQVHDQLVLV